MFDYPLLDPPNKEGIEAWLDELKEEADRLVDKIKALQIVVKSDNDNLWQHSHGQYPILIEQLKLMINYHQCLRRRIEILLPFKGDTCN